MNLKFIIVLFIAISASKIFAQWNPDAGVIPSYMRSATITASSGGNEPDVIDNNEKTKWQSGPPLPNDFVNNKEQNILLNICSSGKCRISEGDNMLRATDGDQKSSVQVKGDAGAWMEINLPGSVPLRLLSVKCVMKSPVYIFAYEGPDSTIIARLDESDNYKWKRFEFGLAAVSMIKVHSDAPFQIFEIAAVSRPLKESVTIDLGGMKNIGWIETRHWAGGKATATELLGSADHREWYLIANLDPKAVHAVATRLANPVMARYLRIQHTLIHEDYAKVFIWEANAWDEHGPYGQMPAAKKSSATVAEIMGVNGLWGWGHGISSDKLSEGKGPQKFNAVASHARSYHNWHWDVTDPDNTPDYSRMAERGTEPMSWLNWDNEYKAWNDAGLKVNACIQFETKKLPMNMWDNPYKGAYNYAFAFAKHFGPTHGNGLVEIMEAGNEPWDYPASFYSEVLRGFTKGAKDADPKMIVLPCALQSAYPQDETETGGSFSGARIPRDAAALIDGLNVHHYSYTRLDNGNRTAVHPEHPESTLRVMLNDVRYRDANMPGKKIYVTEWGWDSDGAGESCTHDVCVTELEQALYAIRGAMFFIRLGADRLNWFNYMNGGGGLYSRSGLVGSPATDFAEKQSFRAMQALLHVLGDRYFLDAVREDDDAWIYSFGDKSGKATHLVAWMPIQGEDTDVTTVQLISEQPAETVWQISGITSKGESSKNLIAYNAAEKIMTLKVSAIPLVVKLAVR